MAAGRSMRGRINIPYFNALGNQVLLSQQQWNPVSKVMHELRPPSLPISMEVLGFGFGQPSTGLISRNGNMKYQILPQFPCARRTPRLRAASHQGKFLACSFSLPDIDWLIKKKTVYKQKWLTTSKSLQQFLYIILTASKWK